MKSIKAITFAIIATALLSAAMTSCSKQETPQIPEIVIPEQQEITLEASMEVPDDNSDTKTSLNSNNTVWWSGTDKISVFFGENTTNKEFNLSSGSGTTSGSFSGTPSETSNTIYAVYPYNVNTTISGSSVTMNLPSVQTYKEGTFDEGMNPAVAYTTSGGNLTFKNLCGIVKLSLTGSDAISKIVLTGADNLSGQATVALSAGDPVLTMTGTNGTDKTVTLNISPAVTLTGTATDFYIVIPPTTKGFRVTIYDADGSHTKATSSVISRNKIRPMPAFAFTEDTPVNLSETATANCYIPSGNAGKYKFKATVMGNGTTGIISGGNFPTADAAIAPVSAALLWQDVPGLISDVTLIDDSGVKYVTFNASKSVLEGNAVIAVYDQANGTGTILWSWHIWCTDQPTDQKYVTADRTGESSYKYPSKELWLLDRNLGATSATAADGVATYGLFYQWGRKDPFSGPNSIGSTTSKALYKGDGTAYALPGPVQTSEIDGTIANTIKNPATFYTNLSEPSDWYWYAGEETARKNDYLWGNPEGSNTTYSASKSIYDPCPPGYMVAPRDTWTNFKNEGTYIYSPNAEGSFSNGYNFYLQGSTFGTPTTWYPAAGYKDSGFGMLFFSNEEGYYWSSSPSGSNAGTIYFYENAMSLWFFGQRANGYSVRCAKEGSF